CPQGGTAVFIDPTQPGNLLAGLQGTLLDRIHLPALVRPCGPRPLASRLASFGRRGLLRLTKVSLQGALTGKVGQRRLLAAQLHENVGGAPGGMEFVQLQGLRQRGRRRRWWGTTVARPQRGLALLAKLLAEAAH